MKTLIILNVFLSLVTFSVGLHLFSRPRSPSEIMKDNEGVLPGEPSCNELREMWRFSRRQSRVAEVTNKLPTYRDPFAFNVWEPLPRLRSVLYRTPVSRPEAPPAYGRIVRHPPRYPPPPSPLDELYREFRGDFDYQGDEDYLKWRRPIGNVYRLPRTQPRYESPSRKFDRIKQMILAERAKENFKKMKGRQGQAAKNAQNQNNEEVNDQGSNYERYSAGEDAKADKLRLAKGGYELDKPPASERLRKPFRRSSPYTWMDPSLIEEYWEFD